MQIIYPRQILQIRYDDDDDNYIISVCLKEYLIF